MALVLGGVRFQGFELPERINFGGRQALAVHKLPGGARVVDAMGRDDDEIAWQGRFRSSSAGRRARAVDAMRAAGRPVTLSWDAFRFRVVIAEFKADFQQAYEIPYSVSCVVVPRQPDAVSSLADLLGADVANALGLAGTLDLNAVAVADAVGGVRDAVAAAKALKAGFPAGLSGVTDALGQAQGVVGQGMAAADALLAAASPSFAATLLNQSAAMTQLDALHALSGTLGRMAVNAGGFR